MGLRRMNRLGKFVAAVGALAVCVVIQGSPQAQGNRTPVDETRRDSAGVAWGYQEFADEITDQWNIVMTATVQHGPSAGAILALLCIERRGWTIRMDLPGWVFVQRRQRLLVRSDHREPFEVEAATNNQLISSIAEFPMESRRKLSDAIIAARERLVVRNMAGDTIVFPISGEAAEIVRWGRRCMEMIRPRQ